MKDKGSTLKRKKKHTNLHYNRWLIRWLSSLSKYREYCHDATERKLLPKVTTIAVPPQSCGRNSDFRPEGRCNLSFSHPTLLGPCKLWVCFPSRWVYILFPMPRHNSVSYLFCSSPLRSSCLVTRPSYTKWCPEVDIILQWIVASSKWWPLQGWCHTAPYCIGRLRGEMAGSPLGRRVRHSTP